MVEAREQEVMKQLSTEKTLKEASMKQLVLERNKKQKLSGEFLETLQLGIDDIDDEFKVRPPLCKIGLVK